MKADAFRKAVENLDLDAFLRTLAPSIVMHSPVDPNQSKAKKPSAHFSPSCFGRSTICTSSANTAPRTAVKDCISARDGYDVSGAWVMHHLLQHEAEHRSEIGWLRRHANEVR